MKKLALIIVVFFLSGSFGTTLAENDKRSGQNETQKQIVKEPEPEKKTQPLPSKGEPWPRTFVPSEKIKADTVVSFPADI